MKRAVFLLLLFLSACSGSEYKGFKKANESLHYKRIYLGDGIAYHPDSCFVDYQVEIKTYFKEGPNIQREIKFAHFSDELMQDSIFKGLQKGDWIQLISDRQGLYFMDLALMEAPDTNLRIFDIRVDEVYNLYDQKADHNVREYKELREFLERKNQFEYNYFNGIWIRWLQSQDMLSESVSGDIVLDYKGYSLQGEAWDIPDFPLYFNTEDSYQVIRGIELALQRMNFGDSVEVVIPSYLAFGEKGSKNGNIPAFKALQYFLKVHEPQDYYSANPASPSKLPDRP